MGEPFEIVLQRVQGTGSVLSLERSLDQSICRSRIFGQDRAMAVGTESIFVPHTFGPVLSVISITFDDLPQQSAMRLFLTFFVLFPPEKPKKSGKDSESISHGAFAAFNHHPINYCPL
jgi:hypothetical protein